MARSQSKFPQPRSGKMVTPLKKRLSFERKQTGSLVGSHMFKMQVGDPSSGVSLRKGGSSSNAAVHALSHPYLQLKGLKERLAPGTTWSSVNEGTGTAT